jgi:hypothetical protein
MRRIGSAARFAWVLLAAAAAASAAPQVEFYQAVDRTEVGIEDTFRLTIVASNAPDSAQVRFPQTDDFEVLSRSQSTELSYQLVGGRSEIKRIQKFVLVMRPNQMGTVLLPPSALVVEGKTFKTDSIQMVVKKGHLRDPNAAQASRPNPFDPFRNFPGMPPMPGFPGMDDDDEDMGIPDVDIPRSDSDLFVRTYADRKEVYQGEQVTLSLYIFSRVDLSEVSALSMPKLDGFWSEDIESPTQLSGEQKILNGIPYRSYLLKRRALFPVKPGTITIGAAEVDVVTGFLFAGRRVHRKGNEVTIKVKPLPAQGRPPGFAAGNVGNWRLATEVGQTQVELGQPITVKVILEGLGNLKNVALPPLTGPSALRIYDPTTTDKGNGKERLGGRRVQEYLVMPQQTGTFTLPGMAFAYFEPQAEKYMVSKTDPITLTVEQGQGAPVVASNGAKSAGGQAEAGVKSIIGQGTGLRPLRYQATFVAPSEPVWRRAFFLPAVFAPFGAFLAMGVFGLVRGALVREDAGTKKRRQARAARKRLARAEQLKAEGKPQEFYGEIEKALLHFLEAKLGMPVGGLTRVLLLDKMRDAGVSEARQQRILRVMDQCDMGRFAPGAGDSARSQVLDEAAAVMEGWD